MKIAAVSEDGITISQHFGRAPFYMIVTIEDGKIVLHEKREKMGHAQFSGDAHEESHDNDPRGHGFNPAAQNRHAMMATVINDCQVLLAGGMGTGAYESMKQAGIQPYITDVRNIDDAVEAYINGTLVDHAEKLH
jgi:predicted Fe-Mo cluster-binding NifX family protein